MKFSLLTKKLEFLHSLEFKGIFDVFSEDFIKVSSSNTNSLLTTHRRYKTQRLEVTCVIPIA